MELMFLRRDRNRLKAIYRRCFRERFQVFWLEIERVGVLCQFALLEANSFTANNKQRTSPTVEKSHRRKFSVNATQRYAKWKKTKRKRDLIS